MPRAVNSVDRSFFVKQYEKVSGESGDGSFKRTLDGLMNRFDEIQTNAAEIGKSAIVGETVDSHDIMIAGQEASLAFELMLEVRNKLLEAYQELMRLQF